MYKRATDLRRRLDALAKKQSLRAINALANRVMDDQEQLSKLPDDIRRAIERYDNPRGLPKGWLVAFLSRDPAQLALDVMRAFDENFKLRTEVRGYKLKIAVLTITISVLLKGIELLLAHAIR